ncbi:MAG TPA: hypothetical protein VK467_09580 [Gemmatimonadales bacterium]|nr:hypothetical protein [Gemmatimonadales bacterium]
MTDDTIDAVLKATEYDLPTSYSYVQQMRTACADLVHAMSTLVDELTADEIQAVARTWQWAQYHASIWQLYAYELGQPIAAEYVQTSFDAARRRTIALAELLAEKRTPVNDPPIAPPGISTTDG